MPAENVSLPENTGVKIPRAVYDWRIKDCELAESKAGDPMLKFTYELVAANSEGAMVPVSKGSEDLVDIAGREVNDWVVFTDTRLAGLTPGTEEYRKAEVTKKFAKQKLAAIHTGTELPLEGAYDPDNIDPSKYIGLTFAALARGVEEPQKDDAGNEIIGIDGRPLTRKSIKIEQITGVARFPDVHPPM